MLAVAVGAIFIGAWGEAVLLLFLFFCVGSHGGVCARSHQREVSALLKSAPKQATLVLETAARVKSPSKRCSAGSGFG